MAEIAELDLVYAPPYSSANDPVNLAAFIAVNDLTGFSPLVTAAALHAEQATEKAPLVVDVRSPEEFAGGSYPGAKNIPVQVIGSRLSEIPKGKPVVVFCRSGARSSAAAATLKQAGYTDVTNAGGLGDMPR